MTLENNYVSYADIQHAYNKLYAELRKYIWDFSAVVALADLEIAVYKTCQDLLDIRVKLSRLKYQIMDVVYQDEELDKRLRYLEDLVTDTKVYVKLNQVQEVLQV